MKNFSFETGKKKFMINGDENKIIEFDPGDSSILERINQAENRIREIEDIKPKSDDFKDVAEAMAEINVTVLKSKFYYKHNI